MRIGEQALRHTLGIIALTLCAAPAMGSALNYAGAHGKNPLGEILHIDGGGTGMFYVQRNKRDKEWNERYDLRAVCPQFPVGGPLMGDTFSCPSTPNFPLAGATYKVKPSKRWRPCNVESYFGTSPGTAYVCVNGCDGHRIARVFHQDVAKC